MAIKHLNFNGNEILKKGNISFAGNNIISVIGMNGSGKTILMKHIKKNFQKEWVQQIVLKKDFEEIEKKLLGIFSVGNDLNKFKKFAKEIKEDGMKKINDVMKDLDNFIWERFLFANENIIIANFEEKNSKKIIDKIKILSKTELFIKKKILKIDNSLSKLIVFNKYENASSEILRIFKKQFGNPKVITIDMTKTPTFNGIIYKNGLGDFSLAETLRNGNNLFVRLIRVSRVEKLLNKICSNEKEFSEEYNNKINDWFKPYISQDIEIKLSIDYENYSIQFNEKENELNFEVLSSGTQNLLKIISQIENVNSETIVQMDEPENGMHPIMQIQFREFLENMSKQFQVRFIIYTHSINIVKNGIETKGLYVISRKNNKSTLYSKDEYILKKDILDIQIYEDVGYQGIESQYNLNNEKKIIVVEGDTDVLYLKKMIKIFKKDFQVIKTKIGGVSTMNKTLMILELIHNFPRKNLIASPDLDIEKKDKFTDKKIKDIIEIKYEKLGTKNRQDIEGFFGKNDSKYICSISENNNTKMNKANKFWREIKTKDDLSPETINNFEKYFEKIS